MPEHRPVTWALLAVSVIVGLAALVRMADPAGTTDELTGVIRLPPLVTRAIVTLFALAALVFVLDVARRMRSRRQKDEEDLGLRLAAPPRQPWLQALTQILSLVNVIVLAYLLWKNVLPLTGLMAAGAGIGSAGGAAPEPAADAPVFITWTFAVLALLAGLVALALAVWLASGERLATWWQGEDDEPAPPPLVEAVEESLEDLRAEPDARRAIIRCYARFERAAATSGIARQPWQTPMEFMREALARLPAPRGAVRALTALFELARFSDRALGGAERDRALDALDDIKTAVERERADAVAP